LDQNKREVGSATSDKKGNWKTTISSEKLGSNDDSLMAKVMGEETQSAAVEFLIKNDKDWLKKLTDFLSRR
jgi:hypothetical protein